MNNNPNYGCILLGSVGKDLYSNKIIDSLNEVGVESLLEIKEDIQTSRCAVGVVNKERCLVGDIQASKYLSLDFVKKNNKVIEQAEIALIEGYFITDRLEIVNYLVDYFNANNKKVAFTLGAVFLMKNYYDIMIDISNKSDIIFCNIEEACALAKIETDDQILVANKIHSILNPRDRILIITNGSQAVLVSKFDYSKNIVDFEIKKHVPKLNSKNIVDTNGCGDCKIFLLINPYFNYYNRKLLLEDFFHNTFRTNL